MEISQKTKTILKNFASIGENLLITPGNTIRTINAGNVVAATAVLDVDFPVEFGIYRLAKFNSILDLFDQPTITFDPDGRSVKISKGKRSYKFLGSPRETIQAPSAVADITEWVASFTLHEVLLKEVTRAASISELPHIGLINDGEKIVLKAFNKDDRSTNDYSVEIRDSDDTNKYRFIFSCEHLKMLPGDYAVRVSMNGRTPIAEFKHLGEYSIMYMVAMDRTSRYGI